MDHSNDLAGYNMGPEHKDLYGFDPGFSRNKLGESVDDKDYN